VRRALSLVCAAVAPLIAAGAASATTLQPVGDFEAPVGVVSDPGDADRLFVVQKGGRVILLENGVGTTVLDISQLVYEGNETGLLSIALAPDFATSGLLYAFYIRDEPGDDPGPEPGDGDLQIDEFTLAGEPVLDTRRPVMTIEMLAPDDPPVSIHNGGQLQFGPDDMLYITVGDGDLDGSGDPFEVAQDPTSLFGKVLRIDPAQAGAQPYSIPEGNPFVDGDDGNADEIWSLGLRNPWRLTFDRLTGAMVVGDVGQNDWEEINWQPGPQAGRAVNFGWDCREGRHEYDPDPHPCTGLTDPVFEYPHAPPRPASVTTGYVVRDPSLCGLEGRLLYADVFTGEIRSQVPGIPDSSGDAATGLSAEWPVSFGEDAAGRLYVVSLAPHGTVYRLVSSPDECGPPPPDVRLCAGEAATVSGDGRLRGTGRADVIVGGAGPDKIKGRGGRDLICAGAGADRVSGGGGTDRLKGGPGRDRLSGGAGADRCRGGPGRDRLRSC
jgi:glucose/arabinose dehydrogenase